MLFFLGQDQLSLKDENVFINLKYSFQFDFLPEVFTLVSFMKIGKLTKARNLMQIELFVCLKSQ